MPIQEMKAVLLCSPYQAGVKRDEIEQSGVWIEQCGNFDAKSNICSCGGMAEAAEASHVTTTSDVGSRFVMEREKEGLLALA